MEIDCSALVLVLVIELIDGFGLKLGLLTK